MSSMMERAEVLHEWGIEPVPETHRHLRVWDVAILWGDLGVGLLVLVTGGFLAGMSLLAATAAIVLGSIIGVGLLAAVAAAGPQHGLATMVLFRPVLGLRGSWVPSVLNIVQLVGWTAVELWAMSFVADLVSRRVFGFSARGLWLGIAAIVCLGLAWWGPVRVTRVWMERFAAWLVIGLMGILTILVLTDRGSITDFPSMGGAPFGLALDLVIAMPISWLPLAADYTRFSNSSRDASAGTFIGYLVANVWLYLLGYLLISKTATIASPEAIALGVIALVGGTIAGALFLIGILVVETDQAFADIYSGAVSFQNVWPNAPQRLLIGVIGLLGAGLAWWLTMERYEAFLFLIGSVFVPLFGVFIADHYVNRRRRIDVPELYRGAGPYWFAGGFRVSMLLPWLAGFVVFHWIVPTGPEWWTSWVGSTLRGPASGGIAALGGSIPAFVVAFFLALRRTPIIDADNRAEERQP
jgi:putative hydroxymethylpyrimidine transporter CytX